MVPKKTKQHKTIFWLFWTIFPKRMGLMIWLGAYHQAKTLGHTSCLFADLCGPFLVDLGVPKWPRKKQKQGRKKQFSGWFDESLTVEDGALLP
jgi:hypothetical protein